MEFIPANLNAVELYGEFRAQLATLKAESSALVFDYASPKGNREARSHIFSLRKVKSALEEARKEAKAASLEYSRLVDSKAREVREELEELIDRHERPLKEIEAREQAKQAEIAERISILNNWRSFPADISSESWLDELNMVESFTIDDSLGQQKPAAALCKDEAITGIRAKLAARQKYEAEQVELARLRAESEARERKEREERIAQEAAAKATREAEFAAERQREADRRAEQERGQKAAEAARQQELALERAKREAAEAQERAAKAEQAAKERAGRELREKQESERREAEKREANKKHQAKVNSAAVSALVMAGVSEDMTKLAVTAIAQRKVPAVTIAY